MLKSSNFEEVAAEMVRVQDFMLQVTDGDDDSKVVGVVMKADIERIRGYSKFGRPSVGEDGKLMVGVAIGTREEEKVKLEHLVKDGVDVVVIDSS